ncbi:MAG: Gfo/Idh/MocA family oxidoreductase [Verrucomicrobiae bacterium]|nr:Gfo/Idh/MocA family oxidoreductase [Verrucomicrobiae bacterium]
MTEPLKIAVLGLIHDHVWDNLPFLAAHSDAELVAAADSNEPLLTRVATEYGCRTYTSTEDLLEKETLDGVYIFSSNREGAELAVKALNKGLHVLIEKPMAASLDQANCMVAAAKESGAKLVINWPFAWWPQLQKALAMAQAGEIGKLWAVKYRAAHAGPAELGCSEYFCNWLFDTHLNGAGALMDYCCYGSVLSASLLGLPETVTAMTGGIVKTGLPVEDNALLAMKYPFGMSSAEGSWTQIGKLTSYTSAIYGTKGTMLVEPRIGGRLLVSTEAEPQGYEVPFEDPEPWLQNSANHFVHVIRENVEPWLLCHPDNGRVAQEILEAGIRSVATGKHLTLPLALD